MTELLRDLAGFDGQSWLAGGIVFLRVGAAMALLPGFGTGTIPPRIRLVLAGAFTLIVAPGAETGALPESFGLPFTLRLLLTESLAGLLIASSRLPQHPQVDGIHNIAHQPRFPFVRQIGIAVIAAAADMVVQQPAVSIRGLEIIASFSKGPDGTLRTTGGGTADQVFLGQTPLGKAKGTLRGRSLTPEQAKFDIPKPPAPPSTQGNPPKAGADGG